MSSLQYSSYDGYGQYALKEFHYSQAVRVGDRIECSGQGASSSSSSQTPPIRCPFVPYIISR